MNVHYLNIVGCDHEEIQFCSFSGAPHSLPAACRGRVREAAAENSKANNRDEEKKPQAPGSVLGLNTMLRIELPGTRGYWSVQQPAPPPLVESVAHGNLGGGALRHLI